GIAFLHVLAASSTAAPPTVTAIELSSTHPLPDDRVRAAIADLAGKALSREGVRDSLARLWSLGRFTSIQVEEIPDGTGVRLRYTLTERLLVRRIDWVGKSGLDLAEVAAAAGLAVGDDASPARLVRGERDLLARYRRDGYLGARVEIRADEV